MLRSPKVENLTKSNVHVYVLTGGPAETRREAPARTANYV